MSTTTAVITAIALAAIGSTVYQAKQTYQAQAELVSLHAERDRLRAQLGPLRDQGVQSGNRIAALQAEVAGLNAGVKAGNGPAPKLVPAEPLAVSRQSEEAARLKTIAEEIAKRRESRMRTLDTTYHALYRQIGFTPEQIAQFKSLVASNMQRNTELMNAALIQNGGKLDPGAQQAINAQTSEELRANLRAAFGDGPYQSIQHFNDTLWLRPPLADLATTLYYTETPLTVDQTEKLVGVVWDNMVNSAGVHSREAANFDAMISQAAGVLSAPQLEAWRQMVGEWQGSGGWARAK